LPAPAQKRSVLCPDDLGQNERAREGLAHASTPDYQIGPQMMLY
jgi:hypothetical protein